MLLLDNDCFPAITGCYGTSTIPNLCSSDCYNSIIQCARDKYGIDFDKAEGLYYGSADNYVGQYIVLGCAGNSNIGYPPYLGSLYGGAVHETAIGNNDGSGSTHELGHDFGLCHNPYGGAALPEPPLSCPNNDPSDQYEIMSYGIREHFASGSMSHLRFRLQEFLGGCK